jgi:hypothetical protein
MAPDRKDLKVQLDVGISVSNAAIDALISKLAKFNVEQKRFEEKAKAAQEAGRPVSQKRYEESASIQAQKASKVYSELSALLRLRTAAEQRVAGDTSELLTSIINGLVEDIKNARIAASAIKNPLPGHGINQQTDEDVRRRSQAELLDQARLVAQEQDIDKRIDEAIAHAGEEGRKRKMSARSENDADALRDTLPEESSARDALDAQLDEEIERQKQEVVSGLTDSVRAGLQEVGKAFQEEVPAEADQVAEILKQAVANKAEQAAKDLPLDFENVDPIPFGEITPEEAQRLTAEAKAAQERQEQRAEELRKVQHETTTEREARQKKELEQAKADEEWLKQQPVGTPFPADRYNTQQLIARHQEENQQTFGRRWNEPARPGGEKPIRGVEQPPATLDITPEQATKQIRDLEAEVDRQRRRIAEQAKQHEEEVIRLQQEAIALKEQTAADLKAQAEASQAELAAVRQDVTAQKAPSAEDRATRANAPDATTTVSPGPTGRPELAGMSDEEAWQDGIDKAKLAAQTASEFVKQTEQEVEDLRRSFEAYDVALKKEEEQPGTLSEAARDRAKVHRAETAATLENKIKELQQAISDEAAAKQNVDSTIAKVDVAMEQKRKDNERIAKAEANAKKSAKERGTTVAGTFDPYGPPVMPKGKTEEEEEIEERESIMTKYKQWLSHQPAEIRQRGQFLLKQIFQLNKSFEEAIRVKVPTGKKDKDGNPEFLPAVTTDQLDALKKYYDTYNRLVAAAEAKLEDDRDVKHFTTSGIEKTIPFGKPIEAEGQMIFDPKVVARAKEIYALMQQLNLPVGDVLKTTQNIDKELAQQITLWIKVQEKAKAAVAESSKEKIPNQNDAIEKLNKRVKTEFGNAFAGFQTRFFGKTVTTFATQMMQPIEAFASAFGEAKAASSAWQSGQDDLNTAIASMGESLTESMLPALQDVTKLVNEFATLIKNNPGLSQVLGTATVSAMIIGWSITALGSAMTIVSSLQSTIPMIANWLGISLTTQAEATALKLATEQAALAARIAEEQAALTVRVTQEQAAAIAAGATTEAAAAAAAATLEAGAATAAATLSAGGVTGTMAKTALAGGQIAAAAAPSAVGGLLGGMSIGAVVAVVTPFLLGAAITGAVALGAKYAYDLYAKGVGKDRNAEQSPAQLFSLVLGGLARFTGSSDERARLIVYTTGVLTGAIQENTKAKEEQETNDARNNIKEDAINAYIEYQKQVQDANKQYEKSRLDIIKEGNKAALQAEKKYKDDLAKLDDEEAKIKAQVTDDDKDAKTARQKDLAEFALSERRAYEDYYRDRSILARDYNLDVQRDEEDHQQKMREMQADHNLKVQDLLFANDAFGLLEEHRNYEKARAEEEANYAKDSKRKNEDFNIRLKDMEDEFAIERQRAWEDFNLKLQDEDKQKEIDRARKLKDIEEKRAELQKQYEDDKKQAEDDRRDKLKELDDQHVEELNRMRTDFADKIRELNAALLGERKLRQDYYTAMGLDLKSWLETYSGAISSSLPNYPKKAGGGYLTNGIYHAGEAGDEFLLTASSTKMMEQAVGGKLTQSNVMAMQRSGNATINQNFRFDSSMSADEKRWFRNTAREEGIRALEVALGA